MPEELDNPDLLKAKQLPQIEELSDSDRQQLILEKTRAIIQSLVWFVVSTPDKYPEIPEHAAEINRLLLEVSMHFENADKGGFNALEMSLFHQIIAEKPINPAELMSLVLSLYLSLRARTSEDYKEMKELSNSNKVKYFLINLNTLIRGFIEEPNHDRLLDLGVLTSAFNRIALDDTNIYISKYKPVATLSNEVEMFLAANFLKGEDSFNIEVMRRFQVRTLNLFRGYSFDVQ